MTMRAKDTRENLLLAASLGFAGFAGVILAAGTRGVFGEDCNSNGIPDSYEIESGAASDCDGDGVLDACDIAEPVLAFRTPDRLDLGAIGSWILSADVNQDWLADLLVFRAEKEGTALEVLLGGGYGRFERCPAVWVGGELRSPCTADLDRDGLPDLAAILGNRVLVFIGAGDGTFGTPSEYPVGRRPIGLAVGDAEGDGRPDLLTGNRDSSDISWLRGAGDGTFEAARNFQVEATMCAMAAGDANGDGALDLFIGDSARPSFCVLLGNGEGGFPKLVRTQLDVIPGKIAVGDFNADGLVDVAAFGTTPRQEVRGILFLRGKGDGSFETASTMPLPTGFGALSFEAADLNGDKSLDLILASQSDGCVAVLFARGPFEMETLKPFFVGFGTKAAAILDFDSDSLLDLVAVNSTGRDLAFLRQETAGDFFAPEVLWTAGGLTRFAVADLTGDGWSDFAIAKGDSVAVRLGGPDGRFAELPPVPVEEGAVWLAAGDVDLDGAIDLAVADYPGSKVVSILLGRGDGTFQALRSLTVENTKLGLALADFDADGRLDLLVPTLHSLLILKGKGDGDFENPREVLPEYGGESGFLVADFDADGRPDIAINVGAQAQVNIIAGRPDGSFSVRQQIRLPASGSPGGFAAGDLNGDGRLDLAVSLAYDDAVGILLGAGDGTFGGFRSFPVAGKDPRGIAVLDADRDGKLDLATADFANGSAGGISVLKGRGDGSFEAPLAMPAGEGPWSVAPVDLDRDGAPDLAVATKVPSGILLFANRTRLPRDTDCDKNGVPDRCDLASGALLDLNENGTADICEGGCRIPGDCNGDRRLDVSDCICLLGFLFLGDPGALPCGDGSGSHPANLKLLDWEGDGALAIADAISLLRFLFLGGPAHPIAVPGQEARACVFLEGC